MQCSATIADAADDATVSGTVAADDAPLPDDATVFAVHATVSADDAPNTALHREEELVCQEVWIKIKVSTKIQEAHQVRQTCFR